MDNIELRDYFAGLAMRAIMTGDDVPWDVMCSELRERPSEKWHPDQWVEMFLRYTAHRAYRHADAMMAQRETP